MWWKVCNSIAICHPLVTDADRDVEEPYLLISEENRRHETSCLRADRPYGQPAIIAEV
jgi:hypothetical protein